MFQIQSRFTSRYRPLSGFRASLTESGAEKPFVRPVAHAGTAQPEVGGNPARPEPSRD